MNTLYKRRISIRKNIVDMQEKTILIDKIKGQIVGAILGDIIASSYDPKMNEGKLPKDNDGYTHRRIKDGITYSRGKVTATIDTMYASIRNTILIFDKETEDLDEFFRLFLNDIHTSQFIPQGSTLRKLFMKTLDVEELYEKKIQHEYILATDKENEKDTNNCLSITSIFGIYPDIDKTFKATQMITSDQRSLDAGILFSTTLRDIYSGIDSTEVLLENSIRRAQNPEIKSVLNNTFFEKDDLDINKNSNESIIETVKIVYSLLHPSHNFDNIENVIMKVVDYSGDISFNGFVAGSLFGALYGYDKIFSNKKTRANIKDIIDNVGDIERNKMVQDLTSILLQVYEG